MAGAGNASEGRLNNDLGPMRRLERGTAGGPKLGRRKRILVEVCRPVRVFI